MIADGEQGEALLQFESEKFSELLERYGLPPLPPYIHRATPDEYAADRERYQTVYAVNQVQLQHPLQDRTLLLN